MFDGTDFRQARVDLGPWAGNEDVKIRFEFSTAGEARPDQSEIVAMPAIRSRMAIALTVSGLMPDRTSTAMGDALPFLTKEFEFDVMGNGTSPGTIRLTLASIQARLKSGVRFNKHSPMRSRFANAIPDLAGDYSTSAFPASGDSVRLFDLAISQATAGRPLTLIQGEFSSTGANLPVSQFGLYEGDKLELAGQRSKGLGGSLGVHIDDIVIGLAERGESVGGAAALPEGVAPTGALDVNPYYLPRFNGEVLPEIVSGPYQIEIRTARDYGDLQTTNC